MDFCRRNAEEVCVNLQVAGIDFFKGTLTGVEFESVILDFLGPISDS
jgi:hypothetical protein